MACASAATLSLEGKVPPWPEPAGSGGTGDKGDTEGSRAPCAPTASPSYLKTHWTLGHGTNPWAKVGSEKKMVRKHVSGYHSDGTQLPFVLAFSQDRVLTYHKLGTCYHTLSVGGSVFCLKR